MNRDTARLFTMLRLHISNARAGIDEDENLELAAATVSVLYSTVKRELGDCRCGAIRAERADYKETIAAVEQARGRP